MVRRVFFSFHYDRDIRRVVQVRNSWVIRAENQTQPFLDKAAWETIRRRGGQAIEKWIEEQLNGTSVTVVLVGAETYTREWVLHEIKRSHQLGKGILAVYIHNVRDPISGTDLKGQNPMDYWTVERDGRSVPLSQLYSTYDWVHDDGRTNLAGWIEAAAKAAGR